MAYFELRAATLYATECLGRLPEKLERACRDCTLTIFTWRLVALAFQYLFFLGVDVGIALSLSPYDVAGALTALSA